MSFLLQGKGLFSKTDFKEGDTIIKEVPLVCAQFSWNELYKYAACEYCLRSLETAEDMTRRLAENPALVLPHPECCSVDSSLYVCCPYCQVKKYFNYLTEYNFFEFLHMMSLFDLWRHFVCIIQ